MRDMDEVTCGTGLAPPLRNVLQCRALEPGRVALRSQARAVVWLVQLPLCMCFIILKNTNTVRDLFLNGFGTSCNFFLPFNSRFLDVDGQTL